MGGGLRGSVQSPVCQAGWAELVEQLLAGHVSVPVGKV